MRCTTCTKYIQDECPVYGHFSDDYYNTKELDWANIDELLNDECEQCTEYIKHK